MNSRACKGAIKFGDFLERRRCAKLLAELSQCKNPFACAHGRPTIFPLVDLKDVEEEFVSRCQRNQKEEACGLKSGLEKRTLSQALRMRMDTTEF